MHDEWRLIRSGALPGAMNMALDATLLEEVAAGRSGPVLRLYRWSPPAISLGYAQPATDVDLDACCELGFDLVRRPTGGRAVLHAEESTYAVLAPDGGIFPMRVLNCYQTIALALQEALLALGLPAELAPGRTRGGGKGEAICFAAPSTSELVYDGCKVAGSAQKRVDGAFLQHGSIPLEMNLDHLARLLTGSSSKAGDLMHKVGWLNRWLAPPPTVEAVEDALVGAFVKTFGPKFRVEEPTSSELERARFLNAKRYGSRQWTLNPTAA